MESPVPAVGRSTLGDFLFPAPAERSTGAIFRWWEARRLRYNLIVGGSGLLALGIGALFSWLPPAAPGFVFPAVAVVVYGVMANLCYTLGSVVEIAVHKIWGREVLPAGPALFRAGLTFSVGLTLLFPAIIIVFVWIIRVILAVF